MKISTLIAITVAGMGTVFAEPQKLTLDELIPGGKNYRYPTAPLNVRWNDDNTLSYTLADSVFTLSANGKRLSGISRTGADSLLAEKKNPNTPRGGETSADGLWTTQNEGNRLFIVHNETGERREISVPDAKDIVWGQSVHRNEFGIAKGTFWAPAGNKLAFYRMDESMVQAYPLVNTDAREAEVRWVKYPMAGMKSHQVTLGVYDPETRQTIYLKTRGEGRNNTDGTVMSDPEHYLTCVTWRPDGRQIFIAELDRAQREMQLNAYDAATGDFIRTLFTETHDKYVEPEAPLFFLPGSNDRFIWQSERDGWNHLYLYDLGATASADGTLREPKQLTSGEWAVTGIVSADPQGKSLYITATEASPLESHLYSVEVKSGRLRRLTSEPGVHRVIMNKAGTAFYDTYSNHTTPRNCQLVTVKNGKRYPIHTAADPYEGKKVPEISVGTLTAADDSTLLYYRIVKPTDFEAGKQYPAVVYLYNGPHAQMITDGWNYAARGWDLHMANLGYVVFTIDGRGSDNRGLAFEQAIWHRLGYIESLDQMRGIDYLRSLPFVDSTRIGIHGWSYGGFMTSYMMLNHPETFKVGVAGGPVLDWSRYEVMYGERYMGTPENNAEGYAANRLIDQADKLKGRLMLIHGDQDNVVVPQHSMQFLKNAVKNSTHPDFLFYPGHEHNVTGPDRVHLHEIITRYFEEHLK